VTIDLANPEKPVVRPELDYYVLGQASRFLQPGAVRIASDEPAGTKLEDVAFRNTNGTVVLYALNAGTASQLLRIGFRGKTVASTIPAGAVATFVWKP
jgi:glucosylceramidase